MDFEKMGDDEFLAVDSDKLTPGQAVRYLTEYDRRFPDEQAAKKAPAGTKRQKAQSDGAGGYVLVTEVVDAYGNWGIDPSVRPEPYIVKPGVDPIDAQWKNNLDRIEQQQRINAANEPAAPTISTSAKQIWGKTDSGEMGWVDNPNYVAPTPPQGPAFSGTAAGMDYASELRRREAEVQAALDQPSTEADIGYKKALTAKTQQDMLGKQQLALQQYNEAIKTIQGMMERGEMEPAEADAYMTGFRDNLDATIRGTTIFDEQKQKQEETRQRANIGKELLNQRLSSGTSLANQLLSGFSQNLDTLGAGLAPGQTVPFDPFTISKSYATDMQGGPEMTGLARALMGGIAPEGYSPTPPQGPGPQQQAPFSTVGQGGGPLADDMAVELALQGIQQGQGVR